MNDWENYCKSKLNLAKSCFKKIFHRDFNWQNPITFTEKIWWLKIFDSTFLKSFCADKITLHDYSKQVLGKDICIPIIKIYENPKDIEYDKLPDKFVIKCNHGSGYNIIVNKNKLNKSEIENKLNTWLNEDYAYKYDCELHYHLIKPKIFIEEYKENLEDIKIFCFNGIPKFCQVDRHFQEHRMNFYDIDWNYMPWLCRTAYPSNPNIIDKKPEQLTEMLELAKKFSKDFKFVRVDLYPRKEGIYLGELTFTPGGGCQYYKGDGDLRLGKMLDL